MLYVVPTNEVQEGTVLIAEGGFTCIDEGCRCTVKNDPTVEVDPECPNAGFYVDCADGKHFLDGQLDFNDGTTYVGFIKG